MAPVSYLTVVVCLLWPRGFAEIASEATTPCTGMCVTSVEDSRKARLEYIKWQILQKLRLDAPPRIAAPTLPEFVYEHLVSDSNNEETELSFGKEDFYGRTRKVVIFPNESSSIDCGPVNNATQVGCYQFYLSKDLSTRSVSSADFWIYLAESNGTATCTVMESLPKAETNTIQSIFAIQGKSEISSGWLKLNISKAIEKWLQDKNFAPKLAVMCNSGLLQELSNDQEPFISIHVDTQDIHSRRKRVIQCKPNITACCKETLEVSFEDFGWKWVISPRSYFANHCRGECLQDLSAAKYLHTTVLQAYLNNGPKTNHTISLCCTPASLKPLTMIYMDKNSSIYKKVLPNMIIDSCSCAF